MDLQDGAVLSPGTRIDQYVIRDVLGRGGFGITYLVHDEALRKDFALKEFFPEGFVTRDSSSGRVEARFSSQDEYEWGLKKFYDEARLLVQFSHPNIVSVRRVFETNNSAYMLLDLIKGSTLEKWLRNLTSAPTQEELDLIVAPLLSALALAHENRTWHLDISPENIMIRGSDGAPILLDFGASRFVMRQNSEYVSKLVYKSGYSAPEQYTSNANRYGPWTDIYALGATLYRAISGSRPLEAPVRQLRDEQKPVAEVARAPYRQSFLQAVDWALKLPPEDRPQSVADWRKGLLAAPAAPSSGSKVVTVMPSTPVAVAAVTLTETQAARSYRVVLVSLLLLVLMFAIGMLVASNPSLRCLLLESSCATADVAVDSQVLQACLQDRIASSPCAARACVPAAAALPHPVRVEQLLASAERACTEEDDRAAQRARECADAKQTSRDYCEISTACLAPYTARFPNGRGRGEFDGRGRQAARDCETASQSRLTEDQSFNTALSCAAASDGCKVAVCFQPYLSAYPAGRHVGRAQGEIAKARCSDPAAIPNGVYLARTQPGCDAGQQSVRVTVQDARVSWQHDARGTTFQWEGTIERDGEVRASVRGVDTMQARGRWNESDRLIEMSYPQCGKVAMTIYQMLRR